MIRKIIISLNFILLATNFSFAQKIKLDWLFIYYMPYDNNLSHLGTDIVEMLKKGTSKNIGAIIQADFSDTIGMKRYSLINNKIDSIKLNCENSVEIKTFRSYLNWIYENYSANNYVITFLDHGGQLNEICIDNYPTENWFNISELSDEIGIFNMKTGKKPELLFLQVCSHGNLEVAFEFKECANYTLFSQIELGAPNSYYEKTLKLLNTKKNINGKKLAEIPDNRRIC